MGAVWMRVRAELRVRFRSSVGHVLVIGLAGGLVTAAAAGARRTSSTYEEFRRAQNTAQMGVANPAEAFGFATVDFDKAVKFPQVVDSARFSFFIGFIKTSRGKILTPIGDQNPVVLFASDDGRFDRDLNRMYILEGRLSDPAVVDEVVASYVASQSYDIRVGDTLEAQFPSFSDFARGPTAKISGPKVHLRVVGIEAEANELPPGLGYPELHLTPAFHRRYKAQSPTFDALDLKLRNDSDTTAVADELQTAIVRKPGPGPTSNRIQFFDEVANARAIARTIHIQAIALWLLAALAGAASLLILGQALVRESFVETHEYPTLRALGMTSDDLFTAGMIRMLVIGVAGALFAVAVAVAVSPAMPIGIPRLVDLHPGISFDALALGLGAVTLVVLVGGLAAFASVRASREGVAAAQAMSRPSRVAAALARRSFPPASVAGVRMALEPGRGRTAVPVRSTLFGTIVAITALLTALTFGASIDHLLHTPRLVGWNWSGAIGDEFDSEDAARVIPVLQADPDVAEFSGGGGTNVQIQSTSIPVLGQDPVKGAIVPLVLDGREPRAVDEIALGSRTLRKIGRSIGDMVSVKVGDQTLDLRVVGRVVLPPLVNDVATGVGGWVTFQGLHRFGPGVAEDVFLFRFAAGVHPMAGLARLKQSLPDLSINLDVGQGEVGNLHRVSGLPLVLAGLLAMIAAATLTHTLMSVVRRRGRDFAILKTLGFSRSQVRATVAWQATTFVAITLLIGIPLGIAAGRWSWTLFADQLGVVPAPIVRRLPVLLAVPAALILGNLIAAVPGRSAARARPATVLRSE